ncbi:MAG TPA: vWA domain-containing protein [Methylibium sp.]|nr:vWA domain-containing protein [Methylibium sp.]
MKARLLALRAALRGRRDALLMLLAALLLGATFLDPGLPVTRAQVDAVAVVDITQSMNVLDGAMPGGGKPVSRLAAAKATLSRLVEQLPCGSRLGLGIFTEYRTLLLLTPIEVCEHQQELLGTLALMDGRMAWAGASEVAKGVNSGMEAVKALEDRPALLFLSDGHESPPVNPRYRPYFTVARGEVRGLLVGVGGDEPLPIPKFDPGGHAVGEWAADEVLQIDPRSLGRGGSVGGEQMVEPEDASVKSLPGVTPGTEHLSALREEYLRLLAGETGLGYQRLGDAAALREALEGPKLAREAPARLDLRPVLGAAALVCLLIPLLPARRQAARPVVQPALSRAMRPQR